jgi:hypothetical protein
MLPNLNSQADFVPKGTMGRTQMLRDCLSESDIYRRLARNGHFFHSDRFGTFYVGAVRRPVRRRLRCTVRLSAPRGKVFLQAVSFQDS